MACNTNNLLIVWEWSMMNGDRCSSFHYRSVQIVFAAWSVKADNSRFVVAFIVAKCLCKTIKRSICYSSKFLGQPQFQLMPFHFGSRHRGAWKWQSNGSSAVEVRMNEENVDKLLSLTHARARKKCRWLLLLLFLLWYEPLNTHAMAWHYVLHTPKWFVACNSRGP